MTLDRIWDKVICSGYEFAAGVGIVLFQLRKHQLLETRDITEATRLLIEVKCSMDYSKLFQFPDYNCESLLSKSLDIWNFFTVSSLTFSIELFENYSNSNFILDEFSI